jgi:hypothetical protein
MTRVGGTTKDTKFTNGGLWELIAESWRAQRLCAPARLPMSDRAGFLAKAQSRKGIMRVGFTTNAFFPLANRNASVETESGHVKKGIKSMGEAT